MSKPTPAEVLHFIATKEPLERTLERFPSLSRRDLDALLDAVASAATPSAPPHPQSTSVATRPAAERDAPSFVPTAVGRPARGPSRVSTEVGGPRRTIGEHRVLQVYSDGAARGNPGPAGAGAVLMTPDGEIVERLGRFLGHATNNYAEYMGLIIGLERARELGAAEVEVFADSELMIRQLQGRYQVKAPNLKPLFAETTALLRGFEQVKLKHVRRELNAEADEMSNRAIDEEL